MWSTLFGSIPTLVNKDSKCMQKDIFRLFCASALRVYIYVMKTITVKPLYNVTRYNIIFNIRHKFAGNKIPSLQQNIHLTTPSVTSEKQIYFF